MIGFKTVEETGAKGFSVGCGNVPKDGVVYYDGLEIPEGWEEIEAPDLSKKIYSKLLCYGYTIKDDGNTDVNRDFEEITIRTGGNYLRYNVNNMCIDVLNDFLAVITPWCETERQSGGNPPQIGLKINNAWYIDKMISDRDTAHAVGGLAYTLNYDDDLIRPNYIILQLKAGDTIAFSKKVDDGWSIGHIKIYKLFGTIDDGDMEDLIEDMNLLTNTITVDKATINEG